MAVSDKKGFHLPILLLLLGIGGFAAYTFLNHHKRKKHESELDIELDVPLHHIPIPKTHSNRTDYFDFHGVPIPLDTYTNSRSFDPITVPNFRNKAKTLYKMGWVVPDFEDVSVTDVSQEAMTPYNPYYRRQLHRNPELTRVQNDSFSLFNDDARGDGFTSGLARSYNAYSPQVPPGHSVPIPINQDQQAAMFNEFGPNAPQPVNSTDPVFDAAVADTTSIPPVVVDPGNTVGAHVIGIQNQVLKMIIANTTSVNTILSNIDTIKQSIKQYGTKLRMAYEQVQVGNLSQDQFTQFLMQTVSDVANQLQLPLNPAFAATLSQSPFQPTSPAI